jgi:hypothetical protein
MVIMYIYLEKDVKKKSDSLLIANYDNGIYLEKLKKPQKLQSRYPNSRVLSRKLIIQP